MSCSVYKGYQRRKQTLLLLLVVVTVVVFLFSLTVGAVKIPLLDVIKTLTGFTVTPQWDTILFKIRLPQSLTALVAGIGLSLCGVVMQSTLRNPLGSPFTLGISHAASFGAACSIVMTSSLLEKIPYLAPYVTTASAFFCTLVATAIIMMVSKLKQTVPEVIILTGVALGSLFTASTAAIQYFSDDTELASIIFWSFGDPARASWSELYVILAVVLVASIYFFFQRWNYNAMVSGDDTAKGLGVSVERIRLSAMVVSSLVTAVIIAFLGVIGFVGLVCPHISRRIIGDDHRFLIPFGALSGGVLLLLGDILGRTIIAPNMLPVAIITSFLGAPVFIYLLIRGKR